MIYSLIARITERIPFIKDLIKRLKNDMIFRLDCGFLVSDSVPSEAAYLRMITIISESVINQLTEGRVSFFIGNLIGGLVIIIITFLSVLVLGADITSGQMYPSYTLARKINIGNFIQRVEGTMAIMWVIAIYFKMALFLYCCFRNCANFEFERLSPLNVTFRDDCRRPFCCHISKHHSSTTLGFYNRSSLFLIHRAFFTSNNAGNQYISKKAKGTLGMKILKYIALTIMENIGVIGISVTVK